MNPREEYKAETGSEPDGQAMEWTGDSIVFGADYVEWLEKKYIKSKEPVKVVFNTAEASSEALDRIMRNK